MELEVPLSRLIAGTDNVRRTNPLVDIMVLAALIKSQGLLQRLLVRDLGDGRYRIVDGKRRRAAIRQLVDSGDWPKGKTVGVKIVEASLNDTEVGLAANIGHVEMHPADTFEAFRHRIEDEGSAPEDLAARFGYSVASVRGFLRLANASPRIMKAFRKDEITLAQMRALVITDDHKRQEAAFFDASEHFRSPRELRRRVMAGRLDLADKIVQFVGIDAYEASGGPVTRDLFGQDGEVYIEDSGLLHQLANAKLDEKAESFRKLGWKWVEIRPDFTGGDLAQLSRVSGAIHGFEPTSETARLYAGVVLGIDRDGVLKSVEGVLKAEDAKALARAKTLNHVGSDPPAVHAEPRGLPATIIEELTAIRTLALRSELAKRPDMALAVIVNDLALAALYEPWEWTKLTDFVADSVTVAQFVSDADDRSIAEIDANRKLWRERLPEKVHDLFPWLLAQEQSLLLRLLAFAVAETVNAVRYRHEKSIPSRIRSADRIAREMSLDMKKSWKPDASFLTRLPKAAILAAVAEAFSPEEARNLDHGSKADLVTAAARKLASSDWLPTALRVEESASDKSELNEVIDQDESPE